MSTTETSAWNVEELGRWTDEQSFAVEADRLIAYARATNDPTQAHLSGELAPPVFAIVPPFTQLGEPTMSIVPPELMMRVVHGEQDKVVPVGHSLRMHEALTSCGVPSTLLLEPDSGHAHYFLGTAPNEWAGERGPRFWKETRRFLRRYLLGNGDAAVRINQPKSE